MTKNKKKLIIAAVCAVIVILCAVFAIIYLKGNMMASEVTNDEAYELISETFDKIVEQNQRQSMLFISENSSFKVLDIDYGMSKDIRVNIEISTVDSVGAVADHLDELLSIDTIDPATGIEATSTKLKLKIDAPLTALLEKADKVTKNVDIYIYDTSDGFIVYTSDEVVDAYFGGAVTLCDKVMALESAVTADGERGTVNTNLKRGFTECLKLTYSSRQPDSSTPLIKWFNNLKYDFRRNFIDDGNWQYITKGLWVTVRVTFFATLIGVVIGFLVAIIRTTNEKTGKLKFVNAICKIYLTVLRGTPVLVQLMIIYFVIFMPIGIDKFIAAIMCFGLNSGAYVAEIVRGGIMSIDGGQMEAGRSLGFGYGRTMLYIIMPQTFKAVLPALANEFIVLLKETSVSAYIGLNDLARGGDIIRGITYSAFMPLIAVAIVYLVVVVFLQWLVGKLERRLRTNER